MSKLSRCQTCGGGGELDFPHGDRECYDCWGHGWLWLGFPVKGTALPNDTCQELIEPVDEVHRLGLLRNATQFLDEHRRLSQFLAHGEQQKRELDRGLQKAASDLTDMEQGRWRPRR